MFKKLIAVLALSSSFMTIAADNLILVSMDGVRWQDVFNGAQMSIMVDKDAVARPEELKADFWHDDLQQRREKLMPFLWQTIAQEGALIGNRNQGSNMSVANPFMFSYPGYSEMLTGIVDVNVDSNDKINNPNITFLEWLNRKPKYQNKVAAFTSWDTFPYIINSERSKIPVNAGITNSPETDSYSQLLNQLQTGVPIPWQNVRFDALTHRFAMHHLALDKPKITYIAYDETDNFAHDGLYDQYLYSVKRIDGYLQELWEFIQSTPEYRDNTVMLVVVDHGRGAQVGSWEKHGAQYDISSEQVWLAAIGPGVKSTGNITTPQEVKLNQVAATALTLLGEQASDFNPAAGKPITYILSK